MNGFSLSCTALLGTNKAGTLKPDADGYYTVVLGALDVFNSSGAYYPEASAKHLFQQSASLMRRIASGNLRGEYGHPRPQPGMTPDDWVNRVRDIYEPNVCMHIRKVTVDYTSFRNEQGQPVITIVGEVKPSGPNGPALKEQFDNRHEDVCFSIRSLTNDDFRMGRVTKHIKLIVTWDYVNEPGLAQAHKWNSPSLESHSEAVMGGDAYALAEQMILPGQLLAMSKRMGHSAVSMESNGGVSMESLIEAVTLEPEATRPASARW
ncbi:head maturation protease [Xanthomonas phage RTH11]|nr:head maturation protease [Xanthomonas phage RTH11]